MKTRKLLAMLLTLAMMMGLLCTGAAATYTLTLEDTNSTNEGIYTITAETPVTATCGEPTTSTSSFQNSGVTYHNTQYTYNIALPYTATNGSQVSVTITPDSGVIVAPVPPIPQFYGYLSNLSSAPYTASATLANGTATIVAYVHKDFNNVRNWCDTYTFHFAVEYPISISTSDPVYIAWNGGTGTVTGRDGETYIPQSFTLWAETTSITVNSQPKGYDGADPDNTGNYYFVIMTDADDPTTITATIDSIPYQITCPHYTQIAAGSSPSSVVSYLPIGQYATGSGWGNATGKFANKTALDSTGVSLGALGGYIEFYFGPAGITNDPRNPYGVDFVVYGNAFNGNPEAGAVQVSEDGTVWYELAGSRYYDGGYSFQGNQGGTNKYVHAYNGTLNNAKVIYTLGASDIEVKLGSDGPYTFTAFPAWWPDKTEGSNAYADSVIAAAHQSSYVKIARTGDDADDTLTFEGVTAIPDSDVTADYAFGYADVTPNGSPSSLGDAVNPYTPYNNNGITKTGGDGFDLEWAVNVNTGIPLTADDFYVLDNQGNPTNELKQFHYVRVYTAVLDNGNFNETSTEVCGVFTAYRTTTEDEATSVGRTATPTIRYGTGASTSAITFSNSGDVVEKTIPANSTATKFKVRVDASGADNIYINNGRATSGTTYQIDVPAAGTSQFVRFIVQTGDAAPYIVTLKVTKAAS